MIKSITSLAFAGLVAATISGCGGATPAAPAPALEQLDERCHMEGELAPEWVCGNIDIEGVEYAAVGMGTSKDPSMKVSQGVTRARANLAHQIETKVKSKMEDFMRSTGNGDQETIDAVTTKVTKQTAMVTLNNSRKIKQYEMKGSHNLYVLVATSKETAKEINAKVKETIANSKGNEGALWQQFQSKQAMDSLDKEFPTE
jgi:uncharacterized protein (UPF0333 family)